MRFLGPPLYLLSVLISQLFLKLNQSRLDMQNLLYDIHRHLFQVELQYSATLLYSTTGDYLQLAGTSVSNQSFSNSIDDFIQFIAVSRSSFVTYFGAGTSGQLDSLFLGDICSFASYLQPINGSISRP